MPAGHRKRPWEALAAKLGKYWPVQDYLQVKESIKVSDVLFYIAEIAYLAWRTLDCLSDIKLFSSPSLRFQCNWDGIFDSKFDNAQSILTSVSSGLFSLCSVAAMLLPSAGYRLYTFVRILPSILYSLIVHM
jgi:Na+/pantothenate symporter